MTVTVPGGTLQLNVRRVTALNFPGESGDPDVVYTVDARVGGSVTSEYMSEGIQKNRDYTILVQLTSDGAKWAASGSAFDSERQNIIDGISVTPAVASTGWEDTVLSALTVSDVVRATDTTVAITCAANSSLSISVDQTIAVDIPQSAVSVGTTINSITATNDLTLEDQPSSYAFCQWVTQTTSANRTRECDGSSSNLYTGTHYTFEYAVADTGIIPPTNLIFVDDTDFTVFDMTGACDAPGTTLIRANLLDVTDELRVGEFSNTYFDGQNINNMQVEGASYANLGWTGIRNGYTIPRLDNPYPPLT